MSDEKTGNVVGGGSDLRTVGSVGVVGMGVVGQATANAFLQRTRSIRVHDRVGERSLHSFRDTIDADVVFLCLPTPSVAGRLDVSAVHDVLQRVAGGSRSDNLLVLKSTVPVGTTNAMSVRYGLANLVHCPEFLTAGTADLDAVSPNANVVGFANATDDRVTARVEALLQEMNDSPTYTMRSDESEALKLAMNGFFALKNAFFNGLSELCRRRGMDYRMVVRAMVGEGRVHPVHTAVPGPDGKTGFGGACLPKDSEEYEAVLRDSKVMHHELSNIARLCNRVTRPGG